MDTLSIVENSDVVKRTDPGRLGSRIAFMVDEFRLEDVKEAFFGRIVVAVADAAHTGQDLVFSPQRFIGARKKDLQPEQKEDHGVGAGDSSSRNGRYHSGTVSASAQLAGLKKSVPWSPPAAT